MPPAGKAGRNTALGAGAWGSALALTLLLCALPAHAQWSRPPFPGSPPTKVAGGPDLIWNGTAWEVPQGGVIDWTITITNDAVGVGVQIFLSDDIPDPPDGDPVAPFDIGTDVIDRTPVGVLEYNGDQLSWDDFVLGMGETATVTFRTRVDAGAAPGTEICNTAVVTYVEWEGGGPIGGVPQRWANQALNSDGEEQFECVLVSSGVLLVDSSKSMSEADGDGWIEPGETVDIEIVVRNTGTGDATSLLVTDTLPAGLVPITAGEGGLIAGDTVTWDETTTPALATLRAGRDTTLTLQAVAECTGVSSYCNQAFVTAAEIDFDVPTGDAAIPTPSQPTCLDAASPDFSGSTLGLSESMPDGAFSPGEAVTGNLVLRNTGTSDAGSVEARLDIPSCLVSVVPLNGGVVMGNEIVWDSGGNPALSTMNVGDTEGLGFQAEIDPAAPDASTCCVQAAISSFGCAAVLSDDASTPDPSDATCVTIAADPQLAFRLRATDPDADGVLAVGDVVDFELEVESLGGAPATDLSVDLPLPIAHFASLEADAGLASPDLLTWNATTEPALASVASGETVVLTGRATLTCAVIDGDSDCMLAELVASNLAGLLISDDPDEPGATDATCVDLAAPQLAGSTLAASDNSGDGNYDRGELVSLTLTLTNTGSVPAEDLLVELPVDADDLDLVADNGGQVDPDAVRWNAATTPALASLGPTETVQLGVSLRISSSASGRRCRQASITWPAGACPAELTHDPLLGGDDLATCWDVVGANEPPGEVPDGDPADGGPVPVRLTCEGADLVLEWDAAPNATTHVVLRGPLDSFRDQPWTNPASSIDDPENAASSCDLVVLTYRDEDECATGGEDHYFLVGGRNLIGDGPLGEMRRGATLEERPTVPAPCP